MAVQKSEASRVVWGLLWGLRMQNRTSRHISDQVQTTAEDIQNRGVARFLLDSQLLSLTAFLDFQDRPFQPLTHPSARKSSLAAGALAHGRGGTRKCKPGKRLREDKFSCRRRRSDIQ